MLGSYSSDVSITVNSVATSLVEYARWKNVSPDGCRTKADVDDRAKMLKAVERAHTEGRLIR